MLKALRIERVRLDGDLAHTLAGLVAGNEGCVIPFDCHALIVRMGISVAGAGSGSGHALTRDEDHLGRHPASRLVNTVQGVESQMAFSAERQKLYQWLRRCLIGPESPHGAEILNGIKPLDRYQSAILFPIITGESGLEGVDNEDDGDEGAESLTDDATAQPSAGGTSQPKRRLVPPSSVGLSFFVSGADIRLQLIPRAVRYEPVEQREEGRFVSEQWQRLILGKNDCEARDLRSPSRRRTGSWREAVFEGRAELFALWRPLQDGWLVTVSLSNTQNEPETDDRAKQSMERNRLALLEVELECVVDAGEVGPYPGVQYGLLSDEEQELEVQYRHHRIYAIGHGAAVDWRLRDDRVVEIRTEFLPKTEVPRVSADTAETDDNILRVEWLAGIATDPKSHCDALIRFVSAYDTWIETAAQRIDGLADLELAAAQRIRVRMEEAVTRMRSGIDRLRHDPIAARAFALANQAMAMQMRQADKASGKPGRAPRWRPFQLAFLLLTIESAIDEDGEHRDTLDLIWFPTGGGKTEAYLGLMACVICWRRLRYPASSGGTTILMRYTLRLLTKDQFRRAARLICALELMRRGLPELGGEPITLGLWVGAASSPNSFDDAQGALDKACEDDARPPSLLVLDTCPWCGEAFRVPRNFDAGAKHFRFRCTSADCGFGKTPDDALPCNVVDTALYEAPPTLLLATVDKFARLAWEERAAAFLGAGGNRPPELIIQDELHLIASALGSVAGLYEAGLETVLTMRGVRPKYVASTATIRMAQDQVQRLYGREAAIFPPPGFDCDDAYFARTVPTSEQPGRLYVGYLAPARNRHRSMAPLAAALLAAPEVLFADATVNRDALLDAWWTLMIYHSSLKGVGTSRNALQDIEQFMARQQREVLEQRQSDAQADWPRREQLAERIGQLTSHMSADDNARGFDRLRLPRHDPDALDLVLATNMISVGLDVARLATMIVNGQPLTTAEYIQASSRVGRGDVPGIVVANYYRDQARSLSHYESFRAYHESFYRFVEPTSVTPYTYQARLRALHAALVIAVRHCDLGLAANERAGDFDPTRPAVAQVIEELKRRCRRADPQRGDATVAHIDRLAAQWADAVLRCRTQRERLIYSGSDSDRRDQRLLYSHEARVKGLWATLNNMRNVENTALVKIL